MQKYGISVPVIDGDTKNRQAVVRTFNETPGFGIMILSPKAAGVGLTITSANHVAFTIQDGGTLLSRTKLLTVRTVLVKKKMSMSIKL
jgi:hypothetical protein